MRSPADLVVLGARIRTGDPRRPTAAALAVRGGSVIAVGDDAEVASLSGPATEVLRLEGAFVTAGFHDAHLHLSRGAAATLSLDLRDARSAEDVARRVTARAALVPPGTWIRGFGWDLDAWSGADAPERGMLGRAAPSHPVFLSRRDGHAAWINAAAGRALGTGADEGDAILAEGEMERAEERLPPDDPAVLRAAILEGIAAANRFGITTVQDVADTGVVPVYQGLREENRLGVRVGLWLPDAAACEEAESARRLAPPDDPWLAATTRKIFLDGTLGARTAALLEPYADRPDWRGELRHRADALAARIRALDDDGWAIALHAVGDRAVRQALDVLGRLSPRSRPRPHRIEHVQVVARRDLPRFAALGVVASVQPIHLAEDRPWVEERLGGGGREIAYPLASLITSGAVVALGTDWPVAPLDPLAGIAAALLRRAPGSGDPPLGPREAGDAESVLAAYTEGPAAAAGRSARSGRLAPGCDADFVVLDEDPRRIDPDELPGRIRVLETRVGGRRVFPGGPGDGAV